MTWPSTLSMGWMVRSKLLEHLSHVERQSLLRCCRSVGGLLVQFENGGDEMFVFGFKSSPFQLYKMHP